MKAILNLRKHSYVKIIGTFLIAIALIAGVVGCEGEGEDEYTLTMAVNPAGAGTATDVTGTSPYAEGTDVDIQAVPASCYRFVSWSAPVGTFTDANNATTTFTMPAQDVTVTANFETVPPDHYKFYQVDWETAPYVGKDVHLVDQFGAFDVTIGDAIIFGNPVEKVHNDTLTPIEDDTRHYTLYEIDYGEVEPILGTWKVVVNNQFQDDVELTVQGPIALAVPTQKEGHEMPVCLNHFLVYMVMEEGFPEVSVNLKDQFVPDGEDVTVWEPVLFANPVQKTVDDVVTEIEKDDEHLVFYSIEDIGFDESINKTIQIDNQFGSQTLDLTYRDTLAVPSQKISWEQPLDHFKAYFASWAGGEPPATFPVEVQLKDQFITEWLGEPISANVTGPVLFANPADKWHLDEWTPISDPNDHLTFYWIDYDEEFAKTWDVTVKNQFGEDQWLRVAGPLFLAVPTKKGPHDPPVGLDHFLVYEVLDYDNEPVEVIVDLWDQFTLYNDNVGVYEPELFANPVQKIHGSEVVDIKNPDDHLLFYWINGGDFYLPELPIANQFGPQFLTVEEEMNPLLGVPSVKIEWAPWEPIL
jgi:hypothetical protein